MKIFSDKPILLRQTQNHLLFLLLFLFMCDQVAHIECASCTSLYMGGPSPDCTDFNHPFCVMVSVNPPTYTCSECVSDCDCSINTYCSRNVYDGIAGTCTTFKAEGKKCIDMPNSDILDAWIPDTYKCGDVIRKGNDVMMVDSPRNSSCIEGICRSCDPYSNAQICVKGRVSTRGCAVPGKINSINGLKWVAGTYYQDPTYVWFAVCFSVIVVLAFTQCLILWKNRISCKLPFSRNSLAPGGYESFGR